MKKNDNEPVRINKQKKSDKRYKNYKGLLAKSKQGLIDKEWKRNN